MSEEIHVQVAVGIQQTADKEEGRSTSVTIKDFKSLTVLEQNAEGKQESTFAFDCVFEQDTDQERVYNSLVKPLLSRVKLGYNVSLVVCGTSGESKLLEGGGREDGIMHKMLDDVFTGRRSEEDHSKELITFSDIQFHPDGSIVDLLSPHAREIQCLQHSVLGLVLAELSEMVVSSSEDAWSLYQQGSEARRLGGTHLDRCNTVTLERQETPTACVRSCFRIFDLTGGSPGDAANGVSTLENVLSEGPTQRPLERLLHQSLRGNSCSALICCLTLPESWPGQTVSALSLAHRVTGLTHQVSRFCWDFQDVTRKLRSAIGELRKRVNETSDLCGEDVEQLGRFVQELQMVKKQRWEKKEENSVKCKEEWRQHLKAKQGLSEQVTDPRNIPLEDRHCSIESPCVLLQKYSQEKDKIRRMKQELRDQVAEYLKAGSRSTGVKTTLLSNMRELRERLQVETERFEHTREEPELLESVAELSQGTVPLQSDLDRLYTEAQQRRTRLAEDNAALLQQELLRMEQELGLQQQAGGSGTTTETAEEAARLRRERDVMVLQLVALRKEKQEAENDLQTMHQKYRVELEEHKLQALQVLHEFEEASRQQQSALEERYRCLLQEAIADAVYLATQKHELELGMKELRRVIAHLQDQLSATGQREELPL